MRMDKDPQDVFGIAAVFLGHQLIATLGVMTGAAFGAFALFEIFRLVNPDLAAHGVHHILTEIPYFPLQIVEGLFIGYIMHRRFKHTAALWAWVLPLLWLTCFFFSLSQSVVGGTWIARLNHFFGNGCNLRMTPHCYDQISATLPLYASLAYSLGAWIEKIGLLRFEHLADSKKVSDHS